MPLFMDIHVVDDDNFSVEEVARAHTQDLAIQDKFGVKQLKYWVNVEQKTIFCLMSGPDKASCDAVHRESHGSTACNIISVADDEFGNYMGNGKSVNDLAYTTSGEIDTGYRTLLMVNTFDFLGENSHYTKKIHQLIDEYNGTITLQPDRNIVASFTLASKAIVCASTIVSLLDAITGNYQYRLSLVTGRPVDVNGEKLFEETKSKVELLNRISLDHRIYMDTSTSLIVDKETNQPEVKEENFTILSVKDISFIEKVFDVIDIEMFKADFDLKKLNAVIGLSKSQSHKKIKSITGLAPGQLIQKVRLQHSLPLVQQNSKTIAEVAYELGFNSPTYFTRAFKKEFNLLPTSLAKV